MRKRVKILLEFLFFKKKKLLLLLIPVVKYFSHFAYHRSCVVRKNLSLYSLVRSTVHSVDGAGGGEGDGRRFPARSDRNYQAMRAPLALSSNSNPHENN